MPNLTYCVFLNARMRQIKKSENTTSHSSGCKMAGEQLRMCRAPVDFRFASQD